MSGISTTGNLNLTVRKVNGPKQTCGGLFLGLTYDQVEQNYQRPITRRILRDRGAAMKTE